MEFVQEPALIEYACAYRRRCPPACARWEFEEPLFERELADLAAETATVIDRGHGDRNSGEAVYE